jgi:hypothetical protein
MIFLMLFSFFKSALAQNTEDTKIAQIKSNLLKAMGGQKNYDKTRFIKWTFFGSRTLTWDKYKSRVRIDFNKENSTYILNINEKTGLVLKNGIQLTHPDSLAKYLEEAKKIWINDSYWLVMPFKLNDPGLSIKYLGEGTSQSKQDSDILELSFHNVGVTPNNKYHIYIDKNTHLVNQWSFFGNYTDEKPRFTMPWQDYKTYGKILLSGDRGERKLTDIAVFNKLPETVFSNLEKTTY